MPKGCSLCGSWKHSAPNCDATPEQRFMYTLDALALKWQTSEFSITNDYLDGKLSGLNQCGDDLRHLIFEHTNGAHGRPNKESLKPDETQRPLPLGKVTNLPPQAPAPFAGEVE